MDEKHRHSLELALDGELDEGEAIVARCRNGQIEVESHWDEEPADLSKSHEELYGLMLEINEEISDAGTSLFPIIAALTGGFCLAVHLEWFERLFEIDLEQLRSLWFYIIFPIVVFFAYGGLIDVLERRVYGRRRPELMRFVYDARFSRHVLLTRIGRDENLKNLCERLKKDWQIEDPLD